MDAINCASHASRSCTYNEQFNIKNQTEKINHIQTLTAAILKYVNNLTSVYSQWCGPKYIFIIINHQK